MNMYNKLKTKEDQLHLNNMKLIDAERQKTVLEEELKEYQLSNSNILNQIEDLNKTTKEELKIKEEKEKLIEDEERKARQLEFEIKKQSDNLELNQKARDQLYDDNVKLYQEIEKLKNKIMILTDQNTKVTFLI